LFLIDSNWEIEKVISTQMEDLTGKKEKQNKQQEAESERNILMCTLKHLPTWIWSFPTGGDDNTPPGTQVPM
jgi:hypothetical protein